MHYYEKRYAGLIYRVTIPAMADEPVLYHVRSSGAVEWQRIPKGPNSIRRLMGSLFAEQLSLHPRTRKSKRTPERQAASPGIKSLDFEKAATLLAAADNQTRYLLIFLLLDQERDVGTLATIAGISSSLASSYLRQLRVAGIVVPRRAGQTKYYRLASVEMRRLIECVRQLPLLQSTLDK
ncbi:ArsR family transcriptional regulator [Rhizobium sp. XQZ8]|uniref:ArsR/SmtB family transcription factor n=1 Tax=Rhizobium populisoli TaxID=2859785 RepID=UPI001CA47010|nr:metalloregulator ArsR/SmtB family transcription factor [Rhizobium populisoli]MBW6424938.1 ArsR family transcriptional regulator [Rhizobium populisoli]